VGRFLLLALALLSACAQAAAPTAPTASQQPPTAAAPTAIVPTAAPPTATAPPASPTPLPPTATLAPTMEPTATALPSPTPEPYPELVQFTIDGLRSRSYGSGEIELVRVLEEAESFTRYLIAYPSDGLRITGMLNRPRGDGPFPVVILNHGYYPLDAYQTGNGTRLAADYLAARGFLTVSPDFRSHAGSDDAPNQFRAGHVIDTLNLIPLAQKLPDALPGKVLMWGHSNGGAITSKVIAVSDQIAAALIYSPASSNIEQDYQFRSGRWRLRADQPPGRRTGVIDRLQIEFPVTPEEAPDLYARMSPLNYASYVSARVLIVWGDQDGTVPREWPEDLFNALQTAGKEVEFVVYPGEPHSFTAFGNGQYLPRMVELYQGALDGE
jgi:uncharacterized protein